jgi:hypothetical protein
MFKKVGPEGEKKYSSRPTFSLTSAIDGASWLTPRSSRFTPGKEIRYPFYSSFCGPRVRSGRVGRILSSLKFKPRTVQRVASRYTDWAIPTAATGGNPVAVNKYIIYKITAPTYIYICILKFVKVMNSCLFWPPSWASSVMMICWCHYFIYIRLMHRSWIIGSTELWCAPVG